MRRTLLTVTVLVLSVGLWMAPAGADAAAPKDFAKGSGTIYEGIFGEEQRFSFNAWSDPANNDPHGWMRLEYRGTVFYAVVTCLAVEGNRATIWGDITSVKGEPAIFPAHDGLVFWVTDSGDLATPDLFQSLTQPDSARAGECVALPGNHAITRGNITVIDQ